MAQLPGAFNPEQHGDMQDFSAFPEGWYHMQVVESEIKRTKKAEENNDDSLGMQLILKIQVLDGKWKGRFVWERLNIINPNAETQRIANENLATLCRVLGFNNGLPQQDTNHLHGKPFDGRVGIKKGNAGYNDQNKMNNYKPYGSQEIDVSGGNNSAVNTTQAVKMNTQANPQSTSQNANKGPSVW